MTVKDEIHPDFRLWALLPVDDCIRSGVPLFCQQMALEWSDHHDDSAVSVSVQTLVITIVRVDMCVCVCTCMYIYMNEYVCVNVKLLIRNMNCLFLHFCM